MHDTNLVFIHIPKNAGQAVTSSFGVKHLSTDHSIASAEDKQYMSPPFIRFCVVRDPVSRFISAYKYHCHMQHINTERVAVRSLIRHSGLDEDVNKFTRHVIASGINLQNDLWFRRQVFWLRATKPHIILRHENLEDDLEIISRLIPQHFVGLRSVNASKGRPRSDMATADLNAESQNFVKTFYEKDFFYLSYST
jgi:hypothetical protein